MSVSITGKLNKAPNEFAAGDSTGFGLRLGQQYYDRETKQKEWTNYECVIFARQQGQIDFYRQALVEGAIVAVSGKEQKIRSFDGNNGTVLSIEIMNASIDNVFAPMGNSPATPQQQAPQTPPAQPQSFGSFGDPWEGLVPAGEPATKGATIEQIKGHPDVGGDVNKAKQFGWVADSGDSSIPF